jgi:hypothetical protein
MTARRPSALSIIKEAQAIGQPVRVVYTHAGDMIIEPCRLTDADAGGHVPRHDPTANLAANQATNQADILAHFKRRIDHAQKRAS